MFLAVNPLQFTLQPSAESSRWNGRLCPVPFASSLLRPGGQALDKEVGHGRCGVLIPPRRGVSLGARQAGPPVRPGHWGGLAAGLSPVGGMLAAGAPEAGPLEAHSARGPGWKSLEAWNLESMLRDSQ